MTDAAPPRGASRRMVLGGLGLVAAGCPFPGAPAEARTVDPVAAPMPSATDRVPWLGRHQAGVVTPKPVSGMVAGFHVVADTPADLEDMFRRLTARIAFLTGGGAPPELDPRLPPAGSGILGPVVPPDALTVTVSLGASLFENRPWLAPLRPRGLTRMAQFPNDALDARLCHGDLSLQICANTPDTTIHALRDIVKALPDRLVLKWKQEGHVPFRRPGPDGRMPSERNFLGFLDGSANADAGDGALMDALVWVGADRDEPGWTRGGSYQAVRIIRNLVERWDRTPLGEQERIIGRHRATGAPLGRPQAGEFDLPDFAADPGGVVTPLDAHIRLANPRSPETGRGILLRRGFNYSNGLTPAGQLDQGLLFICYQADLAAGFIAIQRRLDGEPLEEYIRPVGGGYFFTLPGVEDAADHLGSTLIAAL